MNEAVCRIDVWLWRARFARTRSLAAALVERGAIRLTHNGMQTRLDKPSRSVHVGDGLVFALGGRLIDLTVRGLGSRRGPPEEARSLYALRDAGPG
ncbi:S4 domain-containing protein [Brevundimonas basaltis]|uniref:Ribosome-associated heat shock protein Hsp15 n=1 Tax=Brevundimonas basaltis TaxID=472166 RepID=A0A7W8HYP5_9CAUL|nr:RNA-binding S4 domain-containing protein [Brevundimonas basaltis]MBB5292342.1 ribosome-associated heat shock protein Hsp15 [Brevundimonas basaltis]